MATPPWIPPSSTTATSWGRGSPAAVATTTGAPLKPERAAALAALPGWRWTLTEDRWPDGLAALRTYVHRHGTARIPHDTVVDGFPLGHWVAARRAQRKRNALTPAQVRTLAALPGWVWEIRQTRWEQGLRLLTAYADRTGAPNPNSFYVEATEDNFTLGAWAMSRRKEYRRGVLAADRIQALEAIPGWEWAPYDAAWQRHYQLLPTGWRRAGQRRVPQPTHRRPRSTYRALGHDPTQPPPHRPPYAGPPRRPAISTRLELGTATTPRDRAAARDGNNLSQPAREALEERIAHTAVTRSTSAKRMAGRVA